MAKEKNRYTSIGGGYIGYDTYLFFSSYTQMNYISYSTRIDTNPSTQNLINHPPPQPGHHPATRYRPHQIIDQGAQTGVMAVSGVSISEGAADGGEEEGVVDCPEAGEDEQAGGRGGRGGREGGGILLTLPAHTHTPISSQSRFLPHRTYHHLAHLYP